jgi:hypothetical protein
MEPDPFGYLGDNDLYRYLHNAPENRVDPFGLQDIKPKPDDRPFPKDGTPMDFIIVSCPKNTDGVKIGSYIGSKFYPGTPIYADSLEDAIDQIRMKMCGKKDPYIRSCEFWGHGCGACMFVGESKICTNDPATPNPFRPNGPFSDLKPFIYRPTRIYFRGCEIFRGPEGKQFAKDACKVCDCTVAGHTQWIAKECKAIEEHPFLFAFDVWLAAHGGLFTLPKYIPSYPGYQELKPGEDPTWEDPPSNAPKTCKSKPKGKPPTQK